MALQIDVILVDANGVVHVPVGYGAFARGGEAPAIPAGVAEVQNRLNDRMAVERAAALGAAVRSELAGHCCEASEDKACAEAEAAYDAAEYERLSKRGEDERRAKNRVHARDSADQYVLSHDIAAIVAKHDEAVNSADIWREQGYDGSADSAEVFAARLCEAYCRKQANLVIQKQTALQVEVKALDRLVTSLKSNLSHLDNLAARIGGIAA